jgi:hypothetical protein
VFELQRDNQTQKKAELAIVGVLLPVRLLAECQCEGKGGQIEIAGFDACFGEFARTISILPKI